MEAPLHQFPVPPPPPPPPQDALLLQHAVSARSLMMAAAAAAAGTGFGNKAPPASAAAAGPGREQCPRCASRDTKFCYYNNYNTAQPRHFCRACRRYWTLGGSLRNVPVGGSTRKRPRRPARPSRAAMATPSATTTTASAAAGGGPFSAASPAVATLLQGAAGGGGGFLLSSLLLGSAMSSASASPLLALGAAPLLEGRLGGFDLGLGETAALAIAGGGGAAADLVAHHQTLPPLLPWPGATSAILKGDRAETMTWKDAASSVFPFPAATALWQELAAAAPAVEAAGGLQHHGGATHLLL